MNQVERGALIGQLKSDFKNEPVKMSIIAGVIVLVLISLFQPSTGQNTSEVKADTVIYQRSDEVYKESIKNSNGVVNYELPTTNDTQYVEDAAYIPNYVFVKYRNTSVDVADPRFEYLNTSSSSFIRGAWYDTGNQYMIISLNGVYYHYCSMPTFTWQSFKSADSFGTFYNAYVKGNYDCRLGFVPDYKNDSSTYIPVNNWQPTGGYNYSSDSSSSWRGDINVYGDCEEGSYCYGEDEHGNEVEIYVNTLDGNYGYGEGEDGNEVEFYHDE